MEETLHQGACGVNYVFAILILSSRLMGKRKSKQKAAVTHGGLFVPDVSSGSGCIQAICGAAVVGRDPSAWRVVSAPRHNWVQPLGNPPEGLIFRGIVQGSCCTACAG